ncbi:MAG: hypothetical protein GX620_05160 [Chloroflexi bacterium]|nr:hypothetical protein [Chloroflexota bacterium]
MLTDRIIGAFTFRREVYAEVEKDTSFTSTAWVIVIVVAFLNQLGARASGRIGQWLMGAIIGTAFAVAAFALAAFIISWVGKQLFHAEVDFSEMVRTLGLAYVWNVVGVIGILSVFSAALTCVLSPALVLAAVLGFVSWLLATKEALDLEWGQTIVTVVIGMIISWVVTLIAGVFLGLLGIAAG